MRISGERLKSERDRRGRWSAFVVAGLRHAGRQDRELRELHAVLRAVEAGGGDAVLLEGPAGIGKSRLLAEVSDVARRDGFHVLTACASAAERSFAFGVAGQLLEPLLLSLPSAQHDELLAEPAALAYRVLNWQSPRDERVEQPLDI